jgi:homoserine dehydrogenase
MEEDGLGYAEALAEAQKLGYAEADPTLDVDGTDTAHKLAVLARIAFHGRIPGDAVRCEGINRLSFTDISSARRLGCRIKLLAIANNLNGGLALRVAPTLVPLHHPLATVSKNFNGIYIQSNNAGPTLLTGQGAGAMPTASAVLADVVDLCTGSYQATASRFRFFTSAEDVTILPEEDEVSGYYARFLVPDRTGILAGITNILSNQTISVFSIHQGVPNDAGHATIEIITHPVRRGDFQAAIREIDQSGLTIAKTVTLQRL